MTDLKTQAQQLIELNEKRTPGEWDTRLFCDDHAGFQSFKVTPQKTTLGSLSNGDATFIAHTANHAPAIAQAYLDKCEEVERLREALDIIAKQLLPDEMEPGSGCFESGYTAVIRVARQALGKNNDKTG